METLKNKLCAVGYLSAEAYRPMWEVMERRWRFLERLLFRCSLRRKIGFTEGWARTRALSFSVCAHFAGSITENDAR